MRLLISDANILIDMEAGALMETLFQLPMQFGIPIELLLLLCQECQFRCRMLRRFIHPQRLVL